PETEQGDRARFHHDLKINDNADRRSSGTPQSDRELLLQGHGFSCREGGIEPVDIAFSQSSIG
ncbi:MAG: hypothetical protein KDG54_17450, partial [Geminicoccaceae bacterium]|nr:hypothetical protein [Geminicoccaceae bacterium]